MAQINLPAALPLVPGFSEQQVHDLANIVRSVVQQYFAPSNQTTPPSTTPPSTSPPSTPPAPQEAQKEENEQLLQQATVDDITESTTESITKHGSMPNCKSTLSTISRLCTVRSSGDSAAYLSNLACQHINTLLNYTLLDYTLLDYIGHSKGLKATGQG